MKDRDDSITYYIALVILCVTVGSCAIHYARKSDEAVSRWERMILEGR